MISNKPQKTLPHRDPFLWVDRLLERNEEGTEGVVEYDVRENLEVFKGHFPGNPVFPGVLQMESSGQACIWVRYGELPPGVPLPEVLLVSSKDFKFRKPVVPPCVLQTRCKLEAKKAGLQFWSVELFVNKEMVSFGSCWIKMSDLVTKK